MFHFIIRSDTGTYTITDNTLNQRKTNPSFPEMIDCGLINGSSEAEAFASGCLDLSKK